jgi:hypothetical protein
MKSKVHESLWGPHDNMSQLQTLRPLYLKPDGLPDWQMRQAQWYDYGFKPISLDERYADFCRRLSHRKQKESEK